MLESQTHRKFLEQDWLEILHNESNPSQFISRLKDRIDVTLSDLALIAKRLPDKEFDKIFNIIRLEELLQSLLSFQKDQDSPSIMRPDNHKMMLLIIKLGLQGLMNVQEKQYENTPNISRILNDKLSEAVDICKDLTAEMERKELEKKALGDKLVYLFKLTDLKKDIDNPSLTRLVLSLLKQMKLEGLTNYLDYINVIGGFFKNKQGNRIKDVNRFYLEYESDIVETTTYNKIGEVGLSIDTLNINCKLRIKLNDKKIERTDLILKRMNDDYYFYAPKSIL